MKNMNYSQLIKVYEELSGTSKRLEKRDILSNFLRSVDKKNLENVINLLQGRNFPEWDSRKIGVGNQIIIKSLSNTAGISTKEINGLWADIGDLGKVTEKIMSKKRQATLVSESLTIKGVVIRNQKLSEISGSGTVSKKVNIISELISSTTPVGAKYLVRILLEDLRTGAGLGVIRDAISDAFDIEKSKIQRSYDLTTDLAKVGFIAKTEGESGLDNLTINVGNPIKVMLFQKSETFDDAFDKVGTPAAIEYKYDGFRIQIHRNKSGIKLFTRNLEDVTRQFPDIIEFVKRDINSKSFIIDCEVIGYDQKTKIWRPFQDISQRIKRKYDIEKMVKEVPIMILAFDILFLDSKSLLETPFVKRRKKLNSVIKSEKLVIDVAKSIVTEDVKTAQSFYEGALLAGAEGVMVKNLEGIYKPGSRVGFGLKIKPVMESLDLTIVGAEWGTGKRANWLSSFTLACRDGDTFLEIGKMGTGIKEKESGGLSFPQLTKLLKNNILSENGRNVRIEPGVIIEVEYEEIQKSSTYSSGFALRFPRALGLREDLSLDDVDNLKKITSLKDGQRGRK